MNQTPPMTQAPPMLFCYACAHHWYQRGPEPPAKCPNCQSRTWFNPTTPHRKGRHLHATHQPPPPSLPGLAPPTAAEAGYHVEAKIPPDTDPGPLPEKEDA